MEVVLGPPYVDGTRCHLRRQPFQAEGGEGRLERVLLKGVWELDWDLEAKVRLPESYLPKPASLTQKGPPLARVV